MSWGDHDIAKEGMPYKKEDKPSVKVNSPQLDKEEQEKKIQRTINTWRIANEVTLVEFIKLNHE